MNAFSGSTLMRGILTLLLGLSGACQAGQIDIVGPVGSSAFGSMVKALPNGNFVVTDPNWPNGQKWGAVYLYSPTGTLLTTFTGVANRPVGKAGMVVLKNSNFLVLNVDGDWSGCSTGVDSVTFIDGAAGLQGSVSCGNSLVGFDSEQGWPYAEFKVIELSNGNYVIETPYDIAWGKGTGPASVGAISAANSFHTSYGSTVYSLSNGNFVVADPSWSGVGAVTWGSGSLGLFGKATAANSLVGTQSNDYVGAGGIAELSNGDYVVTSVHWHNGPSADAGAATWCSGIAPTIGVVSQNNSLVGTSPNDRVGTVKALAKGNYVVVSPDWSDWTTNTAGIGAVTWVNQSQPSKRIGIVTPSNSLIGVPYVYNAGGRGVKALSNGNYVVESVRGISTDHYAATWGSGQQGVTGQIDAGNSLIGTSSYTSITPLSNGNYVFADAQWLDSAWVDPDTGAVKSRTVGAVMLASGTVATTGLIDKAEALVGNGFGAPAYGGGSMAGVVALTDGNYAVCTTTWHDYAVTGTPLNLGAVTWGDGLNGAKGVVSKLNSIVGEKAGDKICELDSSPYSSIVPLPNGHYLIRSTAWSNNAMANAGAVTWVQGGAPRTGTVNAFNSIVGSTTNERVGSNASAPIVLSNGSYVLVNAKWTNGGALPGLGSITWGSGSAPTTGVVSVSNSLHGNDVNDALGSGGTMAFKNGRFAVQSPYWHYNGNALGAITFGTGKAGQVGPIAPANSVIGTVVNGGTSMSSDYQANGDRLIVGRPASNIVTLFQLPDDSIFVDGFEG